MKRTIIISLVLIVALSFFNLFLYLSRNNHGGQLNNNTDNAEYGKKYYYRFLNQYRYALNLEQEPLYDALIYRGKDTSEYFRLSELSYKPTLGLYFTNEMCTPCINYCVSKLKEKFPDYQDNEQVILLTRGIEERFKNSLYGKPVYSIKDDEINVLDSNVPIYFLFDQDLVLKFVFVPDELLPEYTDLYLSTIMFKFF